MSSTSNNKFILDARRNIINITNIGERNYFSCFARQTRGYRLRFHLYHIRTIVWKNITSLTEVMRRWVLPTWRMIGRSWGHFIFTSGNTSGGSCSRETVVHIKSGNRASVNWLTWVAELGQHCIGNMLQKFYNGRVSSHSCTEWSS